MAASKDFTEMNTGSVFGSIETATSKRGQQGTASPAEKKERAAALKTQGRKGCKAVRINMAFTPENHEFINVLSRVSGKSMTEFTNFVIASYRREHPDLMEKAKVFIDEINSGSLFETDQAEDQAADTDTPTDAQTDNE